MSCDTLRVDVHSHLLLAAALERMPAGLGHRLDADGRSAGLVA